jgi:tetratricopeptide (TPR) repeat protein
MAYGIFFIILAGTARTQDPASSSDELNQYLRELGLHSLQIEHQLNNLDQEANPVFRQRSTQSLLKEFEETAFRPVSRQLSIDLPRIRNLLVEYPNLGSPSLRLALVQTEFSQNFSSMLYVWKVSLDPNFVESQQQTIRSLIREVELIEQQIEVEWQDSLADPSAVPAQPFDELLLRSAMLRGWLHLTLSVASQLNAEELKASASSIRRVLGMQPPITLDEWLKSKDAISSFEANGLLAMAIGYSLNKADDEANLIFARLTGGEFPISDEVPVWRLKSLVIRQSLNVDDEAVRFLNLTLSESVRQKFIWALIECADVMPSTGDNDSAARLAQLGVAQVLLSAQFHQLNLIPQRIKTLAATSNFVAGWLSSAEYYQLYRESREPHELSIAQQKMADHAINLDDAKIDSRYLAGFYGLHADILFTQRRFEESLAKSRIASEILSRRQLPAEEKNEWLAVSALLELAKQNAEVHQEAFAALERFGERFPANRNSRNLELEKSQLVLSRLPPGESLRTLASKLKQEGYQWQLGYLLVEESYRNFVGIPANNSEHREAAANALELAAQQLIAHPPTPDILRLRAAMLQLRVSLGMSAQPQKLIRGEQELKRLMAGIPEDSQVVAESLALIVTSASQRRDSLAVAEAAKKLLAVATRPDLLEIGRVALAQEIENELLNNSMAAPERKKLVEDAATNYLALIEGVSDSRLQERKNLQVAAVQLTRHLLELNRAGEAKAIVQQLLRVAGDDRIVLKTAGEVFSAVGDQKGALDVYRSLASGVPVASEDWLIAKLGVVRCLRLENRAAAQEVYQQVLELSPNLADEWKVKFDLLLN